MSLFVITAIALVVINVASCRWVQRHWESRIAGNGERIEAKLAEMRKSRVMRHPVAWITRGSDWWYALATAIVNPIIVVAAAAHCRRTADQRAANHDLLRCLRRADGSRLHPHRICTR